MTVQYTFNNNTFTSDPDGNGMYNITQAGNNCGGTKANLSNFKRSNNGAWEGQYFAKTGGKGGGGGTYASQEMSIHYLLKLGCSKVVADGTEKVITKADRAEVAFGNSVVDRMFANYTIIRQYRVLNYRLDFNIKELNIAVEYDEKQHLTQAHKEADAIREAEVKRELGCTFIRVPH